eukprot:gene5789-7286_t
MTLDILTIVVLLLRLGFSLSLVLGVIAIGWFLTYYLLLAQLPIFRELVGKHTENKKRKPQHGQRRQPLRAT